MQISELGLSLLKKFEGWSPRAYKDVAGFWTIGYGHLIKYDDPIRKQIITNGLGTQLLKRDCQYAEKCINNSVLINLTQNQFDALVCFVYNVGINAFKNSKLLKKLNNGDIGGAANEFRRWTTAGGRIISGLVSRRAAEENLFRSN